jgi:hypothetical protein
MILVKKKYSSRIALTGDLTFVKISSNAFHRQTIDSNKLIFESREKGLNIIVVFTHFKVYDKIFFATF